MSFHHDLMIGEKVERLWLDKMLVAFKDSYQTFGKDSRFDIEIPELDVTIEVKYDPKSLETGNVVVEYHHAKPSGILTSEATHWLFDLVDEELWFSRRSLLRAIMCSGEEPVQIHGPEDRHPKMVYLIPKETLRTFANRSPFEVSAAP